MKPDYWKLFMETGAPEMYLMHKATLMEEKDVSEHSGHRSAGPGLQ